MPKALESILNKDKYIGKKKKVKFVLGNCNFILYLTYNNIK